MAKMKIGIADGFGASVDPELFLEMLGIWHCAAPEPFTLATKGDSGARFYVMDSAEHRGARAVTRALEGRAIGYDVIQACLVRLLHFGELVENRPKFGQLVRDGESDGVHEISEALIKACAIARIELTEDRFGFDPDDLLARAIEFEAVYVRH